ncbi:class I SAM-dependent RNA methyltransferase [Candidatus Saccharibacteria bacterium]|nr:class I SAM-dependent RNA methyltransferase [Candidatus Saccharibacteria bacterium]
MAKLFEVIKDQPVTIKKLVPGGQGIGTREDGIKGFFWNALPGETTTEYYLTKKKSHYFEAVATKLENPSNHRIEPLDACYLSTSPWQIMDYAYELEQKSELLTEIFRQNYLNCPEVPVQTDGQDFHYRNKMEYSLYWDIEEEKIKPAFRQRGSHRKIPIKTSSIERPEIFKEALKIINELNVKHEEARKYQSLLLRCNQAGEISGGLYENKKPHPDFNNLTDEILGQKYSYSPNGFFQINIPVYEMALKEIAKHIKTNKVLDLYAGVGTIGLSVAGDKELTLVENNKAAFKELERNVRQKSLQSFSSDHKLGRAALSVSEEKALSISTKAVFANSEDVLSYIEPDQTVILDPPRAGCDKKLLDKLLEIKPATIIYLSCNPATQARDAKILSEKYHITDIVPFNFFPRTPHLENLLVLKISPDE